MVVKNENTKLRGQLQKDTKKANTLNTWEDAILHLNRKSFKRPCVWSLTMKTEPNLCLTDFIGSNSSNWLHFS